MTRDVFGASIADWICHIHMPEKAGIIQESANPPEDL
jgi:hypothetical protein